MFSSTFDTLNMEHDIYVTSIKHNYKQIFMKP